MLASRDRIDPNYCSFRRQLRLYCLSSFELLSRIPEVPVAHRSYHNAPSIAQLKLHPLAPGIFHHSTESLTVRSGSVTTPTFKMESRSKKIMTKPINLIFRFLQNRTRVEIWLYDNVHTRIQGCIIGFDEYMNLVLDEAVEMNTKTSTTTTLGRILLKGDTISLLTSAPHKT